MQPSARRAELSRHDFENSYLSRKALSNFGPPTVSTLAFSEATTATNTTGMPLAPVPPATNAQHRQHVTISHDVQQRRTGRPQTAPSAIPRQSSPVHSRTTAALTNLEDHEDVDDVVGRNSKGTVVPAASGDGHTRYLVPATFSRAGSAGMSDDSDFSDADSLCSSVHSADSVETAASKHATIRYSESVAGQIWNILHRMDEMVLQVKVCALLCVRPAWPVSCAKIIFEASSVAALPFVAGSVQTRILS